MDILFKLLYSPYGPLAHLIMMPLWTYYELLMRWLWTCYGVYYEALQDLLWS